ncbi:hypothetical protein F5883DRAFT_78655 [Diaporthe sp. PMI_573]|nr:hypothetical protein F5883DRAFT_78655 [Diaporthaceae sp. PMI_573]
MVVGKHSNPRTDRQSSLHWPWCHIAQLQKHSCIRIASSFPRPRDAWFGFAGTATNRNYVIYQRKAAPVDKIQEGCHHSASEYFVTVVTTSPVQVGVRTPGVLLAGPSRRHSNTKIDADMRLVSSTTTWLQECAVSYHQHTWVWFAEAAVGGIYLIVMQITAIPVARPLQKRKRKKKGKEKWLMRA